MAEPPPPATGAAAPNALPTMCDSCLGITAYLFCEACKDSMCSACFHAVHKGRLARHATYFIAQPPGVAPDMELLVPAAGPTSARTAASHGHQLLQSTQLRSARAAQEAAELAAGGAGLLPGVAEGEGSGSEGSGEELTAPSAPPPQLSEGRMQRQLEKKLGLDKPVSADGQDESVTLSDIARYLRRRRRLGQLGPTLQMRARLQPMAAVQDAAAALLTEAAAFDAGGFSMLANQKPDAWMAAAAVAGSGHQAYKT